MEGKLHVYYPKRHLTLFEYQLKSRSSTGGGLSLGGRKPAKNVLLFIGGLYDNFLSPSYGLELSSLFTSDPWSVVHVQLSSANTGWGISNLDRDVDQIGTAVEYVRQYVVREYSSSSPDLKPAAEDVNIVLMGHSTGCQDVLHYLHSAVPHGKIRPPIQGAILQAPVSDREAHLHSMSQESTAREAYESLLHQIEATPRDDWDDVILPMKQTKMLFGPTPISITRFLSLTSPKSPEEPGLDDLFSSDLSDERLRDTFGKVSGSSAFRVANRAGPTKPSDHSNPPKQHEKPSMLILISGADEYMPEQIDKKQLLDRWCRALEQDGTAILDEASGIVEGGRHDLGGDNAIAIKGRGDMKMRVLGYLKRVSGQSDKNLDMSDLGQALDEAGDREELGQKRQEGKL